MNGNRLCLYNFAECRQIDALSQQAGLSEKQLMGQAALASYYAIQSHLKEGNHSRQKKERILILCGPGNNGGDALALAHLLISSPHSGLLPEILVFHATGKAKSEAARFYWDILIEKEKFPIGGPEDFLKEKLGGSDLIIEALLGTGQTSPARGAILEMLLHIRKHCLGSRSRSYPYLISLDLPAGLSEKDPADFAAKGFSPLSEKEDYFFTAPDEIHCYGVDKLALRLSSSLCAYSKICLLPIGFLNPKILSIKSRLTHFPELYEEKKKSCNILFRKQASGHKYSAGHGLLIGGSTGMEGAAIMAARSFFAAGGGILQVLLPQASSRLKLAKILPTAMFHDKESIDMGIRPRCILIGPGLDPKDLEEMKDSIQEILEHNHSQAYFILDASAANLIHSPELSFPPKRTILLSHTGEWKGLGASAIKDTESLYANLDFYEKEIGAHAHVLVKDSISVLLSMRENKQEEEKKEESEAILFSRPNAALSVAGSGDNLAGILLSLFARKEKFSPSMILGGFWRKGEDKKRIEKDEEEQRKDLQNKILLGIHLMHQAIQGRIHPRSDEFALLIEKLLSK